MKLEDVKTAKDIVNYIEGCVNDLEAGISTNTETIVFIAELVGHVSQLAANKYLVGFKQHIKANRLMENERFDTMLNDYRNKVRLTDDKPTESK